MKRYKATIMDQRVLLWFKHKPQLLLTHGDNWMAEQHMATRVLVAEASGRWV